MNDDPLLTRRRRELHALGHSIFGKRWNVARHRMVAELTNDDTASSQDLSLAQIEQLIGELRRRRMLAALQRGAEVSEE